MAQQPTLLFMAGGWHSINELDPGTTKTLHAIELE